MSSSQGKSAPVLIRTPDGRETEYPSLGAAAESEGVNRVTIKRAANDGKPLPSGSRAKWIEIAEAPPFEEIPALPVDPAAREIEKDEDAPDMDAEQMRWCAGRLRAHAADLIADAERLEETARELEEES